MLPEILKSVSDSSGLLKEIYGDLAKPGIHQVGKALETVLGIGNTLLIPLSLANEKGKIILEKNLNAYREKINKIPEEEIAEIPPEIGVPILEKLTYTSNEEISALYINLLSKASSLETQDQAHPSFVNLIGSMSPDEASIIKYLRNKDTLPFIDRVINQSGGYKVTESCITNLDAEITTIYPNNIPAYLSNFEGLGIIKFRRDIHILEEGIYEAIEKKNKTIYVGLKSGESQSFKKGVIEITTFGKLFINSCTASLWNT